MLAPFIYRCFFCFLLFFLSFPTRVVHEARQSSSSTVSEQQQNQRVKTRWETRWWMDLEVVDAAGWSFCFLFACVRVPDVSQFLQSNRAALRAVRPLFDPLFDPSLALAGWMKTGSFSLPLCSLSLSVSLCLLLPLTHSLSLSLSLSALLAVLFECDTMLLIAKHYRFNIINSIIK